jgi:type I restriction enzyme S subunit
VSRIDARNGAIGIVPDELDGAVVSNDFPCFDIVEAIPEYLGWYTRTSAFVRSCIRASEGTTNRVRLKEDRFLSIHVPLPPVEEQRRVVARLDNLERLIGAAKQLSEEADATLKALQSAMNRELFGSFDGPEFPLESLVEVSGGGTPSRARPDYWSGTIPWVSPKDMKSRSISDSIEHISEVALTETAAKPIESGAVLIVVRGMILAHTVPSAVLAVRAAINQDMKALRPKEGVLAEYLSCYLWAFNKDLCGLVEKSTHDTRKLETWRLLRFPIKLPPMNVQELILKRVATMSDTMQRLSQQKRLVANELRTLQMAFRKQIFDCVD